MGETVVRTATPGDAPRLAAVYQSAYARNRELGFPAKAESVTPETVVDWVRDDHVLVATRDGTVVGGVRLESTGPERVKLSRLAVHEDWKGEGIGGTLLTRAEGWVAASGHGAIWLTTPPEHPFLLDLYESRGYEVTGQYPIEYRDYDEVRLEKRLD